MISSNEILIYCSNLDHKNCVQQVCFNLFCKIGRLQCVQCIKNEEHSSHPEDQYEIEDMVKYIQEIQTKCDELVDKLSSYVYLIEVELNILKQGLLNKYQIPINKLNKLKNIQINVAFDEMLKFQESTSLITQNLEKFTNEFINELKRNYDELRLKELNYLELDKKELQEAEQLYKQGYNLRSSNKYEEALNFLDQSIALNPNHLLALSCKAYCLRMLSKFNEAIIWADKALALDPKHLNTIYVKARSLYCQLKYTQAIKWADIGLQIDPNHQNFYDTKVRSLILIGQNHEAITMINKILSINPEDANFLKLKGQSLMNLKQYDEAISFCDKALKYENNDEMIYYIKGECLQNQQKYQQALICYDQALQIYSEDITIQNKKAECQKLLKMQDK